MCATCSCHRMRRPCSGRRCALAAAARHRRLRVSDWPGEIGCGVSAGNCMRRSRLSVLVLLAATSALRPRGQPGRFLRRPGRPLPSAGHHPHAHGDPGRGGDRSAQRRQRCRRGAHRAHAAHRAGREVRAGAGSRAALQRRSAVLHRIALDDDLGLLAGARHRRRPHGKGELSVPVPALSSSTKTMQAPIGIVLAVLGTRAGSGRRQHCRRRRARRATGAGPGARSGPRAPRATGDGRDRGLRAGDGCLGGLWWKIGSQATTTATSSSPCRCRPRSRTAAG